MGSMFIDVTLLFGVLASILCPLPSVFGVLAVLFGMHRGYLRLPYTTEEVTIAKHGSLRERKRPFSDQRAPCPPPSTPHKACIAHAWWPRFFWRVRGLL